jgi:hypothetical protein
MKNQNQTFANQFDGEIKVTVSENKIYNKLVEKFGNDHATAACVFQMAKDGDRVGTLYAMAYNQLELPLYEVGTIVMIKGTDSQDAHTFAGESWVPGVITEVRAFAELPYTVDFLRYREYTGKPEKSNRVCRQKTIRPLEWFPTGTFVDSPSTFDEFERLVLNKVTETPMFSELRNPDPVVGTEFNPGDVVLVKANDNPIDEVDHYLAEELDKWYLSRETNYLPVRPLVITEYRDGMYYAEDGKFSIQFPDSSIVGKIEEFSLDGRVYYSKIDNGTEK